MIEDAIVYVNDQPMPTRLHEHGKQPATVYQPRSQWFYSGYLEGKSEEILTLLKNQGNELKFYQGDQEVAHLRGIVWGPVVNMYENHYILHLDWKDE
jgi:hypothetical protein